MQLGDGTNIITLQIVQIIPTIIIIPCLTLSMRIIIVLKRRGEDIPIRICDAGKMQIGKKNCKWKLLA